MTVNGFEVLTVWLPMFFTLHVKYEFLPTTPIYKHDYIKNRILDI